MIADHYRTLGIPATATAEEIRSAYRALAKQFHPDRNKAPGAQQRFVEASQAYFILNDAEARGKYDREYLRYFGTDQEREGQPSSVFEDDDLNRWSRSAREQAEDLSRMAFDEFYEKIKEAGFHLGNGVMMALGILLCCGGCGGIGLGIAALNDSDGVSALVVAFGAAVLAGGMYFCNRSERNYKQRRNNR